MGTLTELNGSSLESASRATVNHRLAPQAAELTYTNDVMLEQLEFLLDHTEEHGICGCSACQRYLRLRAVLMEIFLEPPVKAQSLLAPAA